MRIRHWFEDQNLRLLLRNSSYLAASRAVAAVGGLAALALAGRGLGPALFGTLILIHSFIQAASGLTKFNSWQVVVRYGAPALEKDDIDTFRRATGFAVGLDLASGLVAMVGAMLLLPVLAGWFGLAEPLIPLALAYCLILPTMGSAAASGVLRALDRFDLLAWQGTVTPNVRALLTLLAWLNGSEFAVYLIIWFVSDVVGDLVQWAMAWRELRRRGLLSALRPRFTPAGLPNGWRFALSVNFTASLNIAWGPIARLLVGGLLTPAAAGLYRVASSLADAAQRPSDFLNKAFYPQVMRLDPASKKPWKLMVRATALSAAIGMAMVLLGVLLGHWLLKVAFGPEFVGAYGVLVVLLGAPLIAMISFPLPAMLYSVGRDTLPLYANLVGVLTYVAAVFPLTERLGLVGAGIAFLIGRLAMVTVMALALTGEHKRLRGRPS